MDQSLIFSFESNKSVISLSGFDVDLPHLLKLKMLVRIFESSILQEIVSIMKMTEFCVIPLVQILTSPVLQKLFGFF
jgi:hypothetical protein